METLVDDEGDIQENLEYEDSSVNFENATSNFPVTVIIGAVIIWIGVGLLLYALLIGNAPTFFTLGTLLYPTGTIVFFLGVMRYSRSLSNFRRAITIAISLIILMWGVVSLIPVVTKILEFIPLQLFL